MSNVIDFQAYKEKKLVEQVEFVPPKYEAYCPNCKAPTIRTRTASGAEIHVFDPNNMKAYEKLKLLLENVVMYFKTTDEGVTDDDLIEAFGEGMAEFLKEIYTENGYSKS